MGLFSSGLSRLLNEKINNNIKFSGIIFVCILLISLFGCFEQSVPSQPSASDTEITNDSQTPADIDTSTDTDAAPPATNTGVYRYADIHKGVANVDCYTAVTEDNIKLKMMRYRPNPDAAFNTGKQTVLLFPGIAMNMYQFAVQTPESRKNYYKNMTLPQPLADWAQNDVHIKNDPMKYYGIAHYLWLKGYDVWLANYRGVGREDYKSGYGSNLTNLDVFACLDVPACVDKVYEVTGQYPVIGGHSTGGFVSYAYLQGAYIDVNELGNGYIPHVKSDPALAAERNKNIKGFIGLDPATYLPFALELFAFDNYLFYEAIGLIPIYLDLDVIIDQVVNTYIPGKNLFPTVIGLAFETISALEGIAKLFVPEYLNVFTSVNFWATENTNTYVEDFFVRYIPSGFYLRGFSQYFDMSFNKSVREHWKNGEENKNQIMGPNRGARTDVGYYYYDDNMYKVTVPTIVMSSEQDAMCSTDIIKRVLMEGKTYNPNDEIYEVPGTAHADIPLSNNAPTFTFPKIGAWLDKICK